SGKSCRAGRVAYRLMHHKQAAAPPRPEVVQNRHKLRTEMVQFQAKEAFCRFVSAELFSFLLKKGRLAVLFHFWHSPCFIRDVLAAAITEF
ncbi:hypothetical protein, partial [Klebsiella michiganensis]